MVMVFGFGGQTGMWSDWRALFERRNHLNIDRYKKQAGWERKWQQRFWESCRNLVKLKFGVSNSVEEETPLNCVKAGLRQLLYSFCFWSINLINQISAKLTR